MPAYTKNIRNVECNSVVGGRTGYVGLTGSCTEPFNFYANQQIFCSFSFLYICMYAAILWFSSELINIYCAKK